MRSHDLSSGYGARKPWRHRPPKQIPITDYIEGQCGAPAKIPGACGDREYLADELEFILAMDTYKREKRRPFPNWSEVLGVVKGLGYAKPCVDGALPMSRA